MEHCYNRRTWEEHIRKHRRSIATREHGRIGRTTATRELARSGRIMLQENMAEVSLIEKESFT